LRILQGNPALIVQRLQCWRVTPPKPHLMALFGQIRGRSIGTVAATQHSNLHRGTAFHP